MRPDEDAVVRERWAAGVRDTYIAEELGRSQSMIHRTRKRLGLLPTHGRGRPKKQEQRMFDSVLVAGVVAPPPSVDVLHEAGPVQDGYDDHKRHTIRQGVAHHVDEGSRHTTQRSARCNSGDASEFGQDRCDHRDHEGNAAPAHKSVREGRAADQSIFLPSLKGEDEEPHGDDGGERLSAGDANHCRTLAARWC